MLTRHEQWEAKLHASIETHKATPFAWGRHDCALAVCNHVQAMTGIDLAAAFRGKYASEAQGMAAIAAAYPGVTTLGQLAAAIAAQHGIAEIKPKFAQRGDIALVESNGQQSLAIVHLTGRHVAATGEKGLHLLPLRNVQRAWRVGQLTPGAALTTGDGRVRLVELARKPMPAVKVLTPLTPPTPPTPVKPVTPVTPTKTS